MVTIQKDEYLFDIDLEATRKYYETHSLCDCAGCRNFYAQIRGQYPELEDFLSRFGVAIAKPDEMPWLAINGRMDYTPFYTVTGAAIVMGQSKIKMGETTVVITRGENPSEYIPNEQTEPYFVIGVYGVDLPWVMEETYPAEDTSEPACSFFQKIKNLFRR